MITFVRNKKFLLILIVFILISASAASALEIDWPTSPGGTTLTDTGPNPSDVGDMVKYFYEWAIALGGLATFVALVFAGFKYLSSMGKPEAMKEAREQITSAFFGLALLLFSWLILNVINPELTTFRRNSYNIEYLNQQLLQLQARTLPSCDYVELYAYKDYGGSPMLIPGKEASPPPEDTRLMVGDGYREIRPVSSKAFTSSALPEFGCADPGSDGCTCPEYGCGCVLQLFKTDDKGDPCGFKLGEMSATTKDLLSQEARGEEVTCVRLAGTECQCRVIDNQGDCTTEISPDTGWGDNEFRCFGENRRCLDGECVTCGGTILKDGCNGCSNVTIAPDSPKTLSGNPSKLACWYVGDSGHWTYGDDCTLTCTKKAGKEAECIHANWNDYTETVNGNPVRCYVAKTLWACGACDGIARIDAPLYYGTLDVCHVRIGGKDQECDAFSMVWSRRFCVCDR